MLHQSLGRIGTAVEDHILDHLLELGFDLLVHGKLSGVDDSHVEPGANGVIQKYRVNRLAHHVVAAE